MWWCQKDWTKNKKATEILLVLSTERGVALFCLFPFFSCRVCLLSVMPKKTDWNQTFESVELEKAENGPFDFFPSHKTQWENAKVRDTLKHITSRMFFHLSLVTAPSTTTVPPPPHSHLTSMSFPCPAYILFLPLNAAVKLVFHKTF